MTTLTAFVLGAVFGLVALVFGLSWMAWAAFRPESKKQHNATTASPRLTS